MAKGIIYVMSTAVDGLVKIGRTGTGNFEQRMAHLEGNGYRNVTSLKRQFAIEVGDFEDKEVLLHSLFSRSQVSNTELFSLDLNEVIQLLSSFERDIVYPKEKKKEVFEQATEAVQTGLLPDGEYTGKLVPRQAKKYNSNDCREIRANIVKKRICRLTNFFMQNAWIKRRKTINDN